MMHATGGTTSDYPDRWVQSAFRDAIPGPADKSLHYTDHSVATKITAAANQSPCATKRNMINMIRKPSIRNRTRASRRMGSARRIGDRRGSGGVR